MSLLDDMLRIVDSLARRVGALEAQERAVSLPYTPWADWTPTVTQGVSVTATVTEAKYMIVGKMLHAYGRLAITSAGTNGEVIRVGNLPAPVAWNANSENVIGLMVVGDTSTARRQGFARSTASSSGALIVAHDVITTGVMGNNPAMALANGDTIGFSVTYRIA
jgi:hypothetical protein